MTASDNHWSCYLKPAESADLTATVAHMGWAKRCGFTMQADACAMKIGRIRNRCVKRAAKPEVEEVRHMERRSA